MFDEKSILSELRFRAVRSSGPGGQHVNKTSTKVELTFDIAQSRFLSEQQKDRLKITLKNRLSKLSILTLHCGHSRSQHKNKSIVIQRFLDLIRISLTEQKDRRLTKVPKAEIKKRLYNKRKISEKKSRRKPPGIE